MHVVGCKERTAQWGNRAAIGTMVHRNWAPERGRCENDVQGCATTVGGEIEWIAEDQLDDRDQGEVSLSHTAKLKSREPNVGVASKKQGTMGVHMRDMLHSGSQVAGHHEQCPHEEQ